jgi:hypothetical protein
LGKVIETIEQRDARLRQIGILRNTLEFFAMQRDAAARQVSRLEQEIAALEAVDAPTGATTEEPPR